MYYHCRPLKYVTYGKISPHELEDDFLSPAYKWLSFYCGYRQIWLSRSVSQITGYYREKFLKKRKNYISKRKNNKIYNDSVLFGFDVIKGFSVDYGIWCFLLDILIDADINFSKEEFDKLLVDGLNKHLKWAVDEDYLEDDDEIGKWNKVKNLDVYLEKYLFVKNDQVVVPSLNLKSAKKIICKNDKQKKKLRKMGFIEDRIEVRR